MWEELAGQVVHREQLIIAYVKTLSGSELLGKPMSEVLE